VLGNKLSEHGSSFGSRGEQNLGDDDDDDDDDVLFLFVT
jgi:hypothetical protein